VRSTRYRRRSGLIARELEDEVVVLDPASDLIHRLNPTASIIWRNCESASPEEIAATLAKAFEVEEDEALRDVRETLDRFRALGLLTEGLSRAE
jgi:hypothetical protein